MNRQLCFVSRNKGKIKELQILMPSHIHILSLDDIGCDEEIQEYGKSFEENAIIKATYVQQRYGIESFADDSGLEVEALGGAPGVYSARYAGPECNAEKNIEYLLSQMQAEPNRKAKFVCVIALATFTDIFTFRGEVEGCILEKKAGSNGFGYDPIFQPEGHTQSFAEMDTYLKNSISHRAIAVKKLIQHLCNRCEAPYDDL
ncbi:MAG: RdgB/HAM1 family non-canonical purine NTP pyrophosphatase [Cytophagaceae bacterium]|nr:RdgB/HAM1 family non-canonical purine NTP pyrophosphatase [Cytophagaceae bacterium]MDW8456075.1 RdgB/HAM1 family non-canonical purine NTP pyrophosphatase [Cytophagaceae bacterium]